MEDSFADSFELNTESLQIMGYFYRYSKNLLIIVYRNVVIKIIECALGRRIFTLNELKGKFLVRWVTFFGHMRINW